MFLNFLECSITEDGQALYQNWNYMYHLVPTQVCMKKMNVMYMTNENELQMSPVMRKPTFCICENKDTDQLRVYRKADQRLCFRCLDSTIPLLPKY